MNENSYFTNNLLQRDFLFGSERGKPLEEKLSIKPKKRNEKRGKCNSFGHGSPWYSVHFPSLCID